MHCLEVAGPLPFPAELRSPGLFLSMPPCQFDQGLDPRTVTAVLDPNALASRPRFKHNQVAGRDHQDDDRLLVGRLPRLATRRNDVKVVLEPVVGDATSTNPVRVSSRNDPSSSDIEIKVWRAVVFQARSRKFAAR
jgi:hypothetical protein